ncbi:hypothetical protein TNCV_3932431 [Trichonephila clavipes]|nr:hypothetical protein TNCV_3932431 [Trichonephila clavipes]
MKHVKPHLTFNLEVYNGLVFKRIRHRLYTNKLNVTLDISEMVCLLRCAAAVLVTLMAPMGFVTLLFPDENGSLVHAEKVINEKDETIPDACPDGSYIGFQ